MNNDRRWYIIQTYSGFENSVKEDLERRIETMGQQDYIFNVLIPEEEYEDTKKDGTKVIKKRKMFPSYVFVEMIVTEKSWFIVRNTPKVTGFLGSSGKGAKPVPLPPDEINGILRAVGARSVDVFKIFFAESFVIAFICVIAASLGSYMLCKLLNQLVASEFGASLFVFGPISLVVLTGIAMITAVLATFVPVWGAARKKPVESIRAI